MWAVRVPEADVGWLVRHLFLLRIVMTIGEIFNTLNCCFVGLVSSDLVILSNPNLSTAVQQLVLQLKLQVWNFGVLGDER